MSNKPHNFPLTACILTNRSDDRFKQALGSVKRASEIVVLDNESGGEWEKISDTFPQLLVIPVPGEISDFGSVKQRGISAATNEWVLFLDSDELLPESAWDELEMIMKSGAAGARLIRRDLFLHKELHHSEGGSIRLLRLARKDSCHFIGRVHETLQISGDVIDANIILTHFAHNSISEFLSDVARYSKLAAAEKNSSKTKTLVEMLTYPPAKLFMSLFVQGGILDGWRGVIYACLMSLHSLAVRIYRYETLIRN